MSRRNNQFAPSEEDITKALPFAQQLIDEGWYSTSGKYRRLAKLPEGKTGKQALLEACQKEYDEADYLTEQQKKDWYERNKKWVKGLGERSSTSQFLRVYADESLQKKLTIPQFRAFKKLGGPSA